MKYKFKEQDNIINILEGDDVIAKYRIDKHWEQKNMSIKDDGIHIRLYNRMKKYVDVIVLTNNNEIQNIP